ncbi:unnamed protein product [Rotaria sp. Silwood2]|nr:unnamed protein product [Rotaria sp. Silwood2]
MKHSSAKEVEVRVKRTFLARKKPTNSLIDGQVKISIRFHQLKVRFKQLSVELNLFNNQSSDDRHIRCQRIGTRLHIFILIGSSIILALYSSLTQEIHHETILNPSETQYTTLAQVLGDCVVCPCITKWRSRLLSSTAELRLDDQPISINHLYDIINNENYTKLDHGLTKSDINPKDRQNFSSRLKLVSADVFEI